MTRLSTVARSCSLRVSEDVAVDLDVTVLYSKGCPSWRIVLERVNAAAEQAGIQVRVITRLVETIEDAERFGFPGSPTIPHRWA